MEGFVKQGSRIPYSLNTFLGGQLETTGRLRQGAGSLVDWLRTPFPMPLVIG